MFFHFISSLQKKNPPNASRGKMSFFDLWYTVLCASYYEMLSDYGAYCNRSGMKNDASSKRLASTPSVSASNSSTGLSSALCVKNEKNKQQGKYSGQDIAVNILFCNIIILLCFITNYGYIKVQKIFGSLLSEK